MRAHLAAVPLAEGTGSDATGPGSASHARVRRLDARSSIASSAAGSGAGSRSAMASRRCAMMGTYALQRSVPMSIHRRLSGIME